MTRRRCFGSGLRRVGLLCPTTVLLLLAASPAFGQGDIDASTPRPDAILGPGVLRGRVIDGASRMPAADVNVFAQATRQSARGQPTARILRMTRTDREGKYEFQDLPELDYNVWADAPDRTRVALNSLPVTANEPAVAANIELLEGGWIEGRIVNLRGQSVFENSTHGKAMQVRLNGPSRPRSGDAHETHGVDRDGKFRMRVPPGRNFPSLLDPDDWHRVWHSEFAERGIDVTPGQTVRITFRMLESPPKRPIPPPPAERDPVKLALPVAPERDLTEALRDWGGWYRLDEEGYVEEINMVYDDRTGTRYDNRLGLSDQALRIAPAFVRLKRLYLHGRQATDESMASLEHLPHLETLMIWSAVAITDDGAKHLANLEKLESIHLSESQAGDRLLESLSKLPRLSRISMQNNSFTDAGLQHLSEMRQLRSLWIGLGKNEFSADGLAHLAALENLEELDLQHRGISDAGLEQLTGLISLRSLYLGTSKTTPNGRDTLKKALPKLKMWNEN